MQIYSSRGIIFKTIKYSETSIICDIYTREKGLRSYIVSGVRTSKSGSKAAIYQPLNIIELISTDQGSDKLSRIQDIHLAHHYQQINTNVVVSAISIFMLEICRHAIREKETNEELFDFLADWFIFLDDKLHYHVCAHLLFILELSVELGFGPMNNYSEGEPYFDMMEGIFGLSYIGEYGMNLEESRALSTLLSAKKENLKDISISKDVRLLLTEHLVTFYKLHISGFKDLNSIKVLREVL